MRRNLVRGLGITAASLGVVLGIGGAATASGTGPNANGPAKFGLCTAWKHANSHAKTHSVAFKNLKAAAWAADPKAPTVSAAVTAFCLGVEPPGAATAATHENEHATDNGAGNGSAPVSTPPASGPPSSKPPVSVPVTGGASTGLTHKP